MEMSFQSSVPSREEKLNFFRSLSKVYSKVDDGNPDFLDDDGPSTGTVTTATSENEITVGKKRSLEKSATSLEQRKSAKIEKTTAKPAAATITTESGSNGDKMDSDDDVVFLKSAPISRPELRRPKSKRGAYGTLTSTPSKNVSKRLVEPRRRDTINIAKPSREASTNVSSASGAAVKRNKKGEKMIFEGLTFYYVPNDIKNPIRKKRINRAQELGAKWAMELDERVTHLFVDKKLDWEGLMDYLKTTKLPDGVTVANVEYPAHCIDCGRIVEPIPKRFLISSPQAVIVSTENPKSATPTDPKASPLSLPIKLKKAKQLQLESEISDVDEKDDTRDDAFKAVDTKKDALSEIIMKSKRIADATIFIEQESDEEVDSKEESVLTRASLPGNKSYKFEQHFLCNKTPPRQEKDFPNARTIQILEKLLQYYELTGDQWRVIAYRKAISALKQQKEKICTAGEAKKIRGIGQRIADKIEEIVETDELRRLDYALEDPNYETLSLFLKIYGCGLQQAKVWISQGYRTTDDLLKHAKLSKHQRIGIEHLEDFNTKIPREEVKEHGEIVRSCLKDMDRYLTMEIMGSYRRGKAECGDIDIMVTHPTATVNELHKVLEDLLERLFEVGFLKADMTSSRKVGGMVMHGASQISPDKPWRRLDILMVPNECVGAALLYFTGDDIFNRSIRLLARKKGLKLNQNGLWKGRKTDSNSKVICEGTRVVSGPDEKAIFKYLGVEWREPHERIYH